MEKTLLLLLGLCLLMIVYGIFKVLMVAIRMSQGNRTIFREGELDLILENFRHQQKLKTGESGGPGAGAQGADWSRHPPESASDRVLKGLLPGAVVPPKVVPRFTMPAKKAEVPSAAASPSPSPPKAAPERPHGTIVPPKVVPRLTRPMKVTAGKPEDESRK